jgi:hypothetical protein
LTQSPPQLWRLSPGARRLAALEIDETGKPGSREAAMNLSRGRGTSLAVHVSFEPGEEKTMPRMPLTLALCTLLSSAPLVSPGLALAEPAGTPDRAAQTAPPSRSPTDTGNTTTTVHRTLPARGIDSITPSTPMPMDLPDEAKASEVKNEYAIGMAGLVIIAVFLTALVVGLLYIISRRSWSTTL